MTNPVTLVNSLTCYRDSIVSVNLNNLGSAEKANWSHRVDLSVISSTIMAMAGATDKAVGRRDACRFEVGHQHGAREIAHDCHHSRHVRKPFGVLYMD